MIISLTVIDRNSLDDKSNADLGNNYFENFYQFNDKDNFLK